MKTYAITTPERLERAADIVKWQSDRTRVLNHVAYWKRRQIMDPDNLLPPVTLELGRQAQLFRHDNGKKLLATMYVTGARQFVMDERMVAK